MDFWIYFIIWLAAVLAFSCLIGWRFYRLNRRYHIEIDIEEGPEQHKPMF